MLSCRTGTMLTAFSVRLQCRYFASTYYGRQAPPAQHHNQQIIPQAQALMYSFKDQHYIRKNIGVRIPCTNDDAIKVLMNWNFVRRSSFLCSLREVIVKFGKLTDKQMETFRNVLMSNQLNSAYVCICSPFNFKFVIFGFLS